MKDGEMIYFCLRISRLGCSHYHAATVTKQDQKTTVQILHSAPQNHMTDGQPGTVFAAQRSHGHMFTNLFQSEVSTTIRHNVAKNNYTFSALWSVFLCIPRYAGRPQPPDIDQLFKFVRNVMRDETLKGKFIAHFEKLKKKHPALKKHQPAGIASWILHGGLAAPRFHEWLHSMPTQGGRGG